MSEKENTHKTANSDKMVEFMGTNVNLDGIKNPHLRKVICRSVPGRSSFSYDDSYDDYDRTYDDYRDWNRKTYWDYSDYTKKYVEWKEYDDYVPPKYADWPKSG